MPTKMEDFGCWLSRVFARTDPSQAEWPFIPGTYFVSNPQAPVAVCTLGSVDLAPLVVGNPPPGLCITGKVETENIGIEKIVKNLNANPAEIVRPLAGEVSQAVEQVVAQGEEPLRIKLDNAGYFALNIVDDVIRLEHYSYKEKLLCIIAGQDARSIYLTLIRNGWVTKLDHAAYLGKELNKAELSLEHGFEYRQDGA